MSKKQTVYLAYDIEADGPSPWENSMLSFGAVLLTPEKSILKTWEFVLEPIKDGKQDADTMEFWSKFPEEYKHSTTNQEDPSIVMKSFCEDIDYLKKSFEITPVAWPSAYDWQWINYYCHRYAGRNPLGYSSKCIVSHLWGASHGMNPNIDDELIKKFEEPGFEHTHRPLDDALYEGMCMMNALKFYSVGK